MAPLPTLTVRHLRVRAAHVPMALPLQTSSGTVGIAPLALIDLATEQGITGSTYLFCYTPLGLRPVVQMLANHMTYLEGAPLAPLDLERRLGARFRLLGAKGIVGMALAGIDMAAWDALARAQGLSLTRALGAHPRPIRAYNSCGLGMIGPGRVGAEAQRLVEPGFDAIKVRLGYADLQTDLEVVREVRHAVGDRITLMSDYNQGLNPTEAARRVRALDDLGLHWIEEPTLADDYAGHAQIRAKARTPIQMGENWWGPHEMAKCLEAGASDLGMPDAMKIGGVTGWLRAAALADAAGLPVSSHLFPEVSIHLLTASPTCDWLEYVDWASPVLQQPFAVRGGTAIAPDEPGTGIAWNEDAVARYLVE